MKNEEMYNSVHYNDIQCFYLTGKDCNAQTELDLMRQSLEDARLNKATLKDLAKPYIFKPLMISLALMFFQQFSGVNSVLFNLTTIFSVSYVLNVIVF